MASVGPTTINFPASRSLGRLQCNSSQRTIRQRRVVVIVVVVVVDGVFEVNYGRTLSHVMSKYSRQVESKTLAWFGGIDLHSGLECLRPLIVITELVSVVCSPKIDNNAIEGRRKSVHSWRKLCFTVCKPTTQFLHQSVYILSSTSGWVETLLKVFWFNFFLHFQLILTGCLSQEGFLAQRYQIPFGVSYFTSANALISQSVTMVASLRRQLL